ncbi:hypothetical protein TPAR_07517 [Tolypocladium paradoxum]|uniref:Uncharacterized protein n=1 Tax=Tolypocladium paradoxum TaxID=94208 RepID=A0A2S4KQ21_9HYPO|nr:hypothetical protein TPAR_07517 [Tolypocladium paradoxum]
MASAAAVKPRVPTHVVAALFTLTLPLPGWAASRPPSSTASAIRPLQEHQGPLRRPRHPRPDHRHRDVARRRQGHLPVQGQGDGQARHCRRRRRADD